MTYYPKTGTIYLIHFDRPFGHARHYLGYTCKEDVSLRIEDNLNGRGSNLCRHVFNAGIAMRLAKVWYNLSRKDERRMKGRGLGDRCPICHTISAVRPRWRRGKIPLPGLPGFEHTRTYKTGPGSRQARV